MSNVIKNAVPRYILNGLDDQSTRQVDIEQEARPSHYPLVFLKTASGPEEIFAASDSGLVPVLGSESFNERGKYFNHQTVLAQRVSGAGNTVMVKRYKATDAKYATIRFSLDLLETSVDVFQRNPDGSYLLDANGNKQVSGSKIAGYEGKWVSEVIVDDFGSAPVKAGSMVDQITAEQSQLYPVFDLKVSFFGESGNQFGIRFSAPNMLSSSPINDLVAAENKAQLYRMQCVKRPSVNSLPIVLESIAGDRAVDFALKDDVIDSSVDAELFIDYVGIESYRDLDAAAPIYGPFQELHVYHNNVNTILDAIATTEISNGMIDSADEKHLINILSGVDYRGIPHYTYVVKGPIDGGLLMTEGATHYAMGGSDGDMSEAAYNTFVKDFFDNLGSQVEPLLDSARYPFSVVYDSGFALPTKLAMANILGFRKDVGVVLATQDAGQAPNSAAEDSSVAIALRSRLRMFPESEVYGTPVCRALVVQRCGRLISSKYRGYLPLSIELAEKFARYMGAGSGIWNSSFSPTSETNKIITSFKDVNVSYTSPTVAENDWINGAINCISFDRKSLMFPALQTVYDNDTSIANSAITMFALIELEKVCQAVWRELTGEDKLTNEQFIARSDSKIIEKTQGRFDDRYVIVPETYMTKYDEQRGYSWSTKIHLYASNMKSVGSFTIVGHRREDLE